MSKFEDKALLKQIEEMAADGINQKEIAMTLGFSNAEFSRNAKVKNIWLKGNTQLKVQVKSWYKQLLKERNWHAIKHFLATQCDIIEPKTITIGSSKVDISHLDDEQLRQIIAIAENEKK